MREAFTILTAAIALDLLLGDPRYPLHPVRLIGRLAHFLEVTLWRAKRLRAYLGGSILLALLVLITVALYLSARFASLQGPPWLPYALDCFLLYSVIALKDMVNHAKPIASAIEEGDLIRARASLQMVVARYTDSLDQSAIARAAVESISESLIDGFIAPVFWMLAGSLAGIACDYDPIVTGITAVLAYRCINTLDSMVGYKNDRYRRFGTASARADDALNFLPARLSLPLLLASAACLGLKAGDGWRIAMRDRLNHCSPNSAHAESFFAGALGLSLGGPTRYPHGLVDKPTIGEGTRNATPRHITNACRLTLMAGLLTAFLSGTVMAVAQ